MAEKGKERLLWGERLPAWSLQSPAEASRSTNRQISHGQAQRPQALTVAQGALVVARSDLRKLQKTTKKIKKRTEIESRILRTRKYIK